MILKIRTRAYLSPGPFFDTKLFKRAIGESFDAILMLPRMGTYLFPLTTAAWPAGPLCSEPPEKPLNDYFLPFVYSSNAPKINPCRFGDSFIFKKYSMKKLFLALLLLGAGVSGAVAQCEKKSVLSSSKTEYLDANGELQRSVDETSTVEFDNKEILIQAGPNTTMQGSISSITCEWKTPFKEGKTVLKAAVTDPQGQTVNLTITIEGKDGKISFIAEIAERPDMKVRLVVDKFEEKK